MVISYFSFLFYQKRVTFMMKLIMLNVLLGLNFTPHVLMLNEAMGSHLVIQIGLRVSQT